MAHSATYAESGLADLPQLLNQAWIDLNISEDPMFLNAAPLWNEIVKGSVDVTAKQKQRKQALVTNSLLTNSVTRGQRVRSGGEILTYTPINARITTQWSMFRLEGLLATDRYAMTIGEITGVETMVGDYTRAMQLDSLALLRAYQTYVFTGGIGEHAPLKSVDELAGLQHFVGALPASTYADGIQQGLLSTSAEGTQTGTVHMLDRALTPYRWENRVEACDTTGWASSTIPGETQLLKLLGKIKSYNQGAPVLPVADYETFAALVRNGIFALQRAQLGTSLLNLNKDPNVIGPIAGVMINTDEDIRADLTQFSGTDMENGFIQVITPKNLEFFTGQPFGWTAGFQGRVEENALFCRWEHHFGFGTNNLNAHGILTNTNPLP